MKVKPKHKILIIDNSNSFFYAIQSILQESEFDVIFSNNRTETINLLKKETFKGVFLDIEMSKLFDQLKRNKNNKSIPIIMILSNSNIETIKEWLKKGVYDFLTKPVSKLAVINKIQFAINDHNKKKKIWKTLMLKLNRIYHLSSEKKLLPAMLARF